MKKIVKKNYKILIGIVIGIIISTTIVYSAENILTGSDVTYSNGSSSVDNVQKAIDELYEKSKKQQVPDITKLPNIVSALYYSEDESKDYCITGDEDTCKVITCYQKTEENSCPPGTIINYKVNNEQIIRFHVIKDEGEKIVLQSQKGTVSNIAWNEKNNVKEGPTTALEALEKETKDWTNVNNLEYSIGDDNSTLGYSRCSSANWCHTGGYSLNKSSIHARMITVQELKTLNCVNSTSDNKCPVWVFNYLSKSNEKNNNALSYGVSSGYWTMNYSNKVEANNVIIDNTTAWDMRDYGLLYFSEITSKTNECRAVIEISK